MSGLITRLFEALAGRQAKVLESFDDLAERIAAGEDVNEDEAIEVLQRAIRTPQDLHDRVEVLTQRREWREAIRRAAEEERHVPALQAELEEIAREEAAAVEAARAQSLTRSHPIQQRIRAYLAMKDRAMEAERRLAETADPDVRERMREADARLSAGLAECRERNRRREHMSLQARDLERNDAKLYASEIATVRRVEAEEQAALDAAQADVKAALTEQEAILAAVYGQ